MLCVELGRVYGCDATYLHVFLVEALSSKPPTIPPCVVVTADLSINVPYIFFSADISSRSLWADPTTDLIYPTAFPNSSWLGFNIRVSRRLPHQDLEPHPRTGGIALSSGDSRCRITVEITDPRSKHTRYGLMHTPRARSSFWEVAITDINSRHDKQLTSAFLQAPRNDRHSSMSADSCPFSTNLDVF